ncbi:Aste57867_18570 [Aphanomyces stellatus]|uniref:Aste57867_18570 protein n=1 Tax=Aphanomyces stellatus TaxID=120398 RepID=A0A485LBX9_9STRA|nr:hypothetical protein As57867_018508 [Aphanomyces stellatus]VFT95306.1 Aste57867_18570 [Aphanomyces stellatus]
MFLGILYAVLANSTWGAYPLFWKQFAEIPPLQITAHRILWSFVLLELVLIVTRQAWTFHTTAFTRRNVLTGALSGLLVGSHWLLWVWAVKAGFIVDASLGSFMIPLTTMGLGVVFLKERLHVWQWLGVAIAIAGVAVVAVGYGKFPTKHTQLDAMQGLTLEFAVLSVPSLAYFVVVEAQGTGMMGHMAKNVLLVAGGLATCVPYIWFAMAARRLPLTILGMFGYIVPVGNLLIGVLVYHEPFSTTKLAGFVCLCVALVVFSVDSLLSQRGRDVLTKYDGLHLTTTLEEPLHAGSITAIDVDGRPSHSGPMDTVSIRVN